MAKQLLTNNYSSAILDNWNDFKVIDIKVKEYSKKPALFLHWSYKKYSGYGEIFYKNNKVCNIFGDNDSFLTISQPKNISFKHTCCLYNDQGLETVFNKILDNYFNNTK